MKAFGYEIKKAAAKAASTKAAQNPVGFVGLKGASGIVDEEFIRTLKWPEAGKIYQEMASNDAVVGACLYLMETFIRKAKWHVEVPQTTDSKADATAEENPDAVFIKQCMDDMDKPWDSFISELLSMLTYGFSFHEIIYKVRRGPMEKDSKFKSNYSDGKIGWQSMPIRSQASLKEWEFDPTTGLPITFIQDLGYAAVQGATEARIPLDGNLLFKTKESRGNPEGFSLLRRAYRSWYFKKYIEELEGIGVERHLAGIPILQPDENTPLFDKNNPEMVELLGWATSLVSDIRQDSNHGIVLPYGWELELLSPKGSGSELSTDNIIHRYESRIAVTMLADLVLLGSDRTGSFALAEVKHSLLTTALQAILNSICALLNKEAIPRLLILNGATDLTNMPYIVADGIEEPSLTEIAVLLRAANIDVTKNKELFNYIMHLASAPELTTKEIEPLARASAGSHTATDNDNTDPTGNPADGPRMQDPVDNELK